MREENRELMETLHLFKSLNLSELTPLLTKSEFMTLMAMDSCLTRKQELTVNINEITDRIHILPQAISRNLKSLEEKNYIIRSIDPSDRRNIKVSITPEGKAALKETEDAMDEFTSAVFHQIDPEIMKRLVAYLHDVYDIAKKELQERKKQNEENI